MLWRLSYSFGASLSDVSIAYEDLVTRFVETFASVAKRLDIVVGDMAGLKALNRGKLTERWRSYAPPEWYVRIESECDRRLEAYFRSGPHCTGDAGGLARPGARRAEARERVWRP